MQHCVFKNSLIQCKLFNRKFLHFKVTLLEADQHVSLQPAMAAPPQGVLMETEIHNGVVDLAPTQTEITSPGGELIWELQSK